MQEQETGQPRDVLQQAVMGRADEEARPIEQQQELYQSRRGPESSTRVSKDDDIVRIVRTRLRKTVLTSELCERDVSAIGWEKLALVNDSGGNIHTGLKLDEQRVRIGEETEMKRMLELEVCEEVSEEPAYGKRSWNSSWLHSHKPGLVRSRLCVNRVRGACKRENGFAVTPPLAAMHLVLYHTTSRGQGWCIDEWSVFVAFFHAMIEGELFVRPPKNMRNDKSIWRLLRAMYGTLVASSCCLRLVRGTLRDSQWKIIISMPSVGDNETEGPLVMFHKDDFVAEGHDSALDKLDAMLDSNNIRRSTRIG